MPAWSRAGRGQARGAPLGVTVTEMVSEASRLEVTKDENG